MAEIKDPENTLIIDTTQGRVVIELRPDLAPNHVARIKQLVREGFYDGIVFHRVIDGFMAQTGCPKGTGTGGSSYPNLKAEFNAEPHVRGVCSMARAASRGSAGRKATRRSGRSKSNRSTRMTSGQARRAEDGRNVSSASRGGSCRDP